MVLAYSLGDGAKAGADLRIKKGGHCCFQKKRSA